MRVLFVDDDPQVLELLENYARELGWEQDTAMSGEKALGLLRKNRYDAVVLDIVLPGENGLKIAQTLTAEAGDEAPAVVIMSGRDVYNERGRARLSGAGAVIQKPFRSEHLAEAVRLAMEKARSG